MTLNPPLSYGAKALFMHRSVFNYELLLIRVMAAFIISLCFVCSDMEDFSVSDFKAVSCLVTT